MQITSSKKLPVGHGNVPIVDEYPGLFSPVPEQRAKAFSELVKATTCREVNYLGRKHPALHSHVLEEIVGEAFRTLWAKVGAADAGWAEKWKWAYFRGILKFKGTDAYKKRSRARDRFGAHQSKPVTSTDDLEIYGAIRPGFTERELQSTAFDAIEAVITKLPAQQRRVAEILRDNRDAKVGTKEVIELYQKAHGATLTPAAAKSSMAVVRNKLRAALEQVSAD